MFTLCARTRAKHWEANRTAAKDGAHLPFHLPPNGALSYSPLLDPPLVRYPSWPQAAIPWYHHHRRQSASHSPPVHRTVPTVRATVQPPESKVLPRRCSAAGVMSHGRAFGKPHPLHPTPVVLSWTPTDPVPSVPTPMATTHPASIDTPHPFAPIPPGIPPHHPPYWSKTPAPRRPDESRDDTVIGIWHKYWRHCPNRWRGAIRWCTFDRTALLEVLDRIRVLPSLRIPRIGSTVVSIVAYQMTLSCPLLVRQGWDAERPMLPRSIP
mmetsp:Transcript_1819/g.2183  ORF Transcript_1819/g.2183 Transcript_1819/m.2183 type:complete len:267 (+) Transcript_1819:178-978(+)